MQGSENCCPTSVLSAQVPSPRACSPTHAPVTSLLCLSTSSPSHLFYVLKSHLPMSTLSIFSATLFPLSFDHPLPIPAFQFCKEPLHPFPIRSSRACSEPTRTTRTRGLPCQDSGSMSATECSLTVWWGTRTTKPSSHSSPRSLGCSLTSYTTIYAPTSNHPYLVRD